MYTLYCRIISHTHRLLTQLVNMSVPRSVFVAILVVLYCAQLAYAQAGPVEPPNRLSSSSTGDSFDNTTDATGTSSDDNSTDLCPPVDVCPLPVVYPYSWQSYYPFIWDLSQAPYEIHGAPLQFYRDPAGAMLYLQSLALGAASNLHASALVVAVVSLASVLCATFVH